MLFIAEELLSVIAEDVAKVSRINASSLALPHAPHQITERLGQLSLCALKMRDGKPGKGRGYS